jgi:hypothetical protein
MVVVGKYDKDSSFCSVNATKNKLKCGEEAGCHHSTLSEHPSAFLARSKQKDPTLRFSSFVHLMNIANGEEKRIWR